MLYTNFRKIVWAYYKKNGRHDLPWRNTHNAYEVLVSEVMLQQTQVDRVVPFYTKFIQQFPTPKKLAAAPLSDVLKAWQGLGYNRRAKMLHAAVKEVVARYKGTFPHTAEALEQLPGVGPYTARAVAAFAYNQDGVVIETNIRTVIIHHFFSKKKKVSDTEIARILEKVLPKGKSREWYSALMDYGAYLKRSGISHNVRTKGYTKQSKFSGSLREVRGAILRALADNPCDIKTLASLLDPSRKAQMQKAIQALMKEGLIGEKGSLYRLAD